MGHSARQAFLLVLCISIAFVGSEKCWGEDIVIKCEDAATLDKLVKAWMGARNRVKLDKCNIVGADHSRMRTVFVSCDLKRATQETQEDINGILRPVDLHRAKEDGKDILTLRLLHGEYPTALDVPVDIELILGFEDRDIAQGGNLKCVADTADSIALFVRDAETKKKEIAGKLSGRDKAAVRSLASEFYDNINMNWDKILKLEGFRAGDTKTTIEQYIQEVDSYLEKMHISKEDLGFIGTGTEIGHTPARTTPGPAIATDPKGETGDEPAAVPTDPQDVRGATRQKSPLPVTAATALGPGSPDIIQVPRLYLIAPKKGFGDHFRMLDRNNKYLNIAKLDMVLILEHAFGDQGSNLDYPFQGKVYRMAPSILQLTAVFPRLEGKDHGTIYHQPWRYCNTPYSPHHLHDQHNRKVTIDQFDDVSYRNGTFEITFRTNGGNLDKKSVTQHLYIPSARRTEPYVLLNIEGIKASEMKACKNPTLEPESETYPSLGNKVAFLGGNITSFQITLNISWASVQALRRLPGKKGFYHIECARKPTSQTERPVERAMPTSFGDIKDDLLFANMGSRFLNLKFDRRAFFDLVLLGEHTFEMSYSGESFDAKDFELISSTGDVDAKVPSLSLTSGKIRGEYQQDHKTFRFEIPEKDFETLYRMPGAKPTLGLILPALNLQLVGDDVDLRLARSAIAGKDVELEFVKVDNESESYRTLYKKKAQDGKLLIPISSIPANATHIVAPFHAPYSLRTFFEEIGSGWEIALGDDQEGAPVPRNAEIYNIETRKGLKRFVVRNLQEEVFLTVDLEKKPTAWVASLFSARYKVREVDADSERDPRLPFQVGEDVIRIDMKRVEEFRRSATFNVDIMEPALGALDLIAVVILGILGFALLVRSESRFVKWRRWVPRRSKNRRKSSRSRKNGRRQSQTTETAQQSQRTTETAQQPATPANGSTKRDRSQPPGGPAKALSESGKRAKAETGGPPTSREPNPVPEKDAGSGGERAEAPSVDAEPESSDGTKPPLTEPTKDEARDEPSEELERLRAEKEELAKLAETLLQERQAISALAETRKGDDDSPTMASESNVMSLYLREKEERKRLAKSNGPRLVSTYEQRAFALKFWLRVRDQLEIYSENLEKLHRPEVNNLFEADLLNEIVDPRHQTLRQIIETLQRDIAQTVPGFSVLCRKWQDVSPLDSDRGQRYEVDLDVLGMTTIPVDLSKLAEEPEAVEWKGQLAGFLFHCVIDRIPTLFPSHELLCEGLAEEYRDHLRSGMPTLTADLESTMTRIRKALKNLGILPLDFKLYEDSFKLDQLYSGVQFKTERLSEDFRRHFEQLERSDGAVVRYGGWIFRNSNVDKWLNNSLPVWVYTR